MRRMTDPVFDALANRGYGHETLSNYIANSRRIYAEARRARESEDEKDKTIARLVEVLEGLLFDLDASRNMWNDENSRQGFASLMEVTDILAELKGDTEEGK